MKLAAAVAVYKGSESNLTNCGLRDNGIHLLEGHPILANNKSDCVARMYSPSPYKNTCSIAVDKPICWTNKADLVEER